MVLDFGSDSLLAPSLALTALADWTVRGDFANDGYPSDCVIVKADEDGLTICESDESGAPIRNATWLGPLGRGTAYHGHLMTEPFDWREGQKLLPLAAVNPGTGPVHGSNETDAWINVVKLCEDAGVLDSLDMPEAIKRTPADDESDGRLRYEIVLADRSCQVDMPGIPLVLVRYLGEPDQNIWDFPRLYVDGSSWVWCFAIDQVRAVLGEESLD